MSIDQFSNEGNHKQGDLSHDIPSRSEGNSDLEYFQELADGAPVMIWMSDRSMGCFYFNRAWLDYRGRTLEEEFGNGWAEGVHPEDLERCIQHYGSCFARRNPFAMSYRLQHHSGEYRWILDRGAPHFSAHGEFLGFYGGCAETPAEVAVHRIAELRQALHKMQDFAQRVAATEVKALAQNPFGAKARESTVHHRDHEYSVRKHAAAQIEKLAADMLIHDRIANGACLAA